MLKRVFFGPLGEAWTGLRDASPREVFACGTLIFFILLVGILPNSVLNVISAGVTPVAARLASGAG